MKVICNNNENLNGYLTLGKIYYVDYITQSPFHVCLSHPVDYQITNDVGNKSFYNQSRFITVEEHRERILNDLLKCE